MSVFSSPALCGKPQTRVHTTRNVCSETVVQRHVSCHQQRHFQRSNVAFFQAGQRRKTSSANVHVCTDTLSRIRVINPGLFSHGSHLQSASFQVNNCLDNRVNNRPCEQLAHSTQPVRSRWRAQQPRSHSRRHRANLSRQRGLKTSTHLLGTAKFKVSDLKLREGAASETVINKAYLKTNSLPLDSKNDTTNLHNKSTVRATKTRHGGARRSSRRVQAARLGRGNNVPRHSTTEPDPAWSNGATAVLQRNRPIPPSLCKNMAQVPCHRPSKTRDRLLLPACPRDLPGSLTPQQDGLSQTVQGHGLSPWAPQHASVSQRALEGVNVEARCVGRGGNTKMHPYFAQYYHW